MTINILCQVHDDKTIGVWDIAEKKLLHRFEQAHSDNISGSDNNISGLECGILQEETSPSIRILRQ